MACTVNPQQNDGSPASELTLALNSSLSKASRAEPDRASPVYIWTKNLGKG